MFSWFNGAQQGELKNVWSKNIPMAPMRSQVSSPNVEVKSQLLGLERSTWKSGFYEILIMLYKNIGICVASWV